MRRGHPLIVNIFLNSYGNNSRLITFLLLLKYYNPSLKQGNYCFKNQYIFWLTILLLAVNSEKEQVSKLEYFCHFGASDCFDLGRVDNSSTEWRLNNWNLKDRKATEQNPHYKTIPYNRSLSKQETPSKNLQLLLIRQW